MKDIQLTKDFYLSEFTRSKRATEAGICTGEERCVEPTLSQVVQLTLGAVLLWQPLRDRFGMMTVTGGVRFPELNALLDGSSTSAHLTGDAGDFFFHHASPREVMEYLEQGKLPFDQAIYYPITEHVHLGRIHPTTKHQRHQLLIARNGGTVPWSR